MSNEDVEVRVADQFRSLNSVLGILGGTNLSFLIVSVSEGGREDARPF